MCVGVCQVIIIAFITTASGQLQSIPVHEGRHVCSKAHVHASLTYCTWIWQQTDHMMEMRPIYDTCWDRGTFPPSKYSKQKQKNTVRRQQPFFKSIIKIEWVVFSFSLTFNNFFEIFQVHPVVLTTLKLENLETGEIWQEKCDKIFLFLFLFFLSNWKKINATLWCSGNIPVYLAAACTVVKAAINWSFVIFVFLLLS